MGSGISIGFSKAISASSDEELKAAIAGCSPEAKAKLAAVISATGEIVEIGQLTIRSVSGDVILVMDNMSKAMSVEEVLQKLRVEHPPPKASVYHVVFGDKHLPRKSTLFDCGVKLGGEVLAVSAECVVSEELQAKREDALKAIAADTRGFPAAVALEEAFAMRRPPGRILRVCAAMCRLFEIDPTEDGEIKDPMYGFWQPFKDTFTSDVKVLIAKLEGFKPEFADDIVGNATAAHARIKEYVEHPDFEPEEVAKTALAFINLCAWVLVQIDVLQELSGA